MEIFGAGFKILAWVPREGLMGVTFYKDSNE